MKQEKSCGAIVFRTINSHKEFLVVKMNLGHVSFPKGHVEVGETEEQTAIREVKEETNIDIHILPGFREVVTYSPFPGVMKDVVFFVAQAQSWDVLPQESEISSVGFFPEKEVLQRLTFSSDQTLFQKALSFLENSHEF